MIKFKVDVEKFVRPLSRRPETIDMSPVLVEEYILETAERGQPRVYHTRLTILQRPANEEYIGELYVERDFKVNEYRINDPRSDRCHSMDYLVCPSVHHGYFGRAMIF